MGVVKLKKAELYYHKSVEENIARIIQRSGVCQIIESSEETSVRPAGIDARLARCDEHETHARYLLRALGSYYVDQMSSLDRLLGEKPVLSLNELAQIAQKTDLEKLASSIKIMEAKLNELHIEISQLQANAGILSQIKGFPYPLSVLREGTLTLKGVLGTLASAQVDVLKESLAAYASETELCVLPQSPKDKEAWIVVLYVRAYEQEILELCARDGMTIVDLSVSITGTAAEESEKIKQQLVECEGQKSEILRDLAQMADTWTPIIQESSDYWGVLHDRYRALAVSDTTDSTVRTCFWVPTEALPILQKQVEAVAPSVAFVVFDPTEEDNPPALLQNKPFTRPADALTNLYSPPIYGELDPTPFLAPFFFLFFGMCLGDAGYALVIAAILWMLFKKYRKIPASVKDFIHIFSIGAVFTFLYGAITGSFFGDFIDVFPFMAFLRPIKNFFFVIDPMADPMKVLGISLFLGIVHLMLGLGIAAYDALRKGNYVDAIGDKISWIFFVVGLVLVGTGATGAVPWIIYLLGQCMAVAGACVIFWYAGREKKNIFLKIGSGLYALYGCTSYLGDILSYSRLLALGLGSAVIGSIINLLATMVAEIPFIGWTLALGIVLGGHAFGIAVNLLGAFVHSLRLQYVEFFSKFYSGGGAVFKPLQFTTQYVEVVDGLPQS
ncbi:MAG: V-type ATP synthase subunit I [Synergistaceae bacterium]|jgi:V/A-type H+-transporting ATPase subunit I|nr:V-type ATP synthase subunit I [Synergistaceae bacterium]